MILVAVLGYLVFLAAVVAYVTSPGPDIWTHKAKSRPIPKDEAAQ